MDRMKPPIVGEPLSPMLADDQIRALLRVCSEDRTFAGRQQVMSTSVSQGNAGGNPLSGRAVSA